MTKIYDATIELDNSCLKTKADRAYASLHNGTNLWNWHLFDFNNNSSWLFIDDDKCETLTVLERHVKH